MKNQVDENAMIYLCNKVAVECAPLHPDIVLIYTVHLLPPILQDIKHRKRAYYTVVESWEEMEYCENFFL